MTSIRGTYVMLGGTAGERHGLDDSEGGLLSVGETEEKT